MFLRVGKHVRPLVCKLNRRPMSWKRNLPISSPWETRNPWFDTWREGRDIDRHFENMWRDMNRMMGPRFFDRSRDIGAPRGSGGSMLKCDSSGFELKLDVQEFSPSELNLKLQGNKLTITGKHEQKTDDCGQITREFHRELLIPEDVDLESMSSTISENGMLTINADVKVGEKSAEKVIDIQKEDLKE